MVHHPRADGVQLDVPVAMEKVVVRGDQGRLVAPFPQGPGSLVSTIEVGNISAPQRLHGFGKGTRVGARDEKMQVISHQDVCVDGQGVHARHHPQLVNQPKTIAIATNDVLTIIPADRHVAWNLGNEDSWGTGHAGTTMTRASGGQL